MAMLCGHPFGLARVGTRGKGLLPRSARVSMGLRRKSAAVALGIALACMPWALAQATWQVDALVPDVISVRVPSTHIAFGVSVDDYPPLAFPARYPATAPPGGVLPVQVFSNAQGPWSLALQVPDLSGEAGQGTITADQVLYRVDGGLWQRASTVPQLIYASSGPTGAWREISIEFALELTGREPPGTFAVNAVLTAAVSSLPSAP